MQDNQTTEKQTESATVTTKRREKYFTASRCAKIGIFTALATVLYFFAKFPLPFFPPFWDMKFSDVPVLIGGFALGPLAGVLIVTAMVLLKLPMTSTACVGELADLLIGIAFVLPASLIYRKKKNVKGALLGIGVGTICSVGVAMLVNRFILVKAYMHFYHMDMQTLTNLCKVLSDKITPENFFTYYIFLGVLPFNLLRCTVASVITFLVYKRISNILKKF